MNLLPKNIRYIDGVLWLIKLRWLAIGLVIVSTFIARIIFKLSSQDLVFYSVSGALILENIFSLILLNYVRKKRPDRLSIFAGRVINFQIACDFLALTTLLHFSGGIENPIFFFFSFHMVISAVLLSKRDSYLQTTFALALLWFLAYFEYSGLIRHYTEWIDFDAGTKFYLNRVFIIEILLVFSLTAYLLVYMANHIVGLLRKQENAYHEANLLLQQQDKIKDEYILRVTHNIKGHLAAIQMNLSILNDKSITKTPEVEGELMVTTNSRTARLIQFVKELLKLTQMRLNDVIELETFSLRELIENILISVRNSADQKSIRLQYTIVEEVDTITSSLTSVEEILINLLINAVRYTPDNGTVGLAVTKEKDNIVFEVTDTGIGIPREELPNIFNEFYRASNAKKFVKDGTGLGLAMVKYIAKRCGGNITVDSIEGKGSKFILTLPEKIKESDKKGNRNRILSVYKP